MGMSKSLLPPPFSHTPSRALCWQSPTRSRWLRGKVAGRVPAPASKKKTKQDKVGLELRRKSTITKRVTWENSLVCSWPWKSKLTRCSYWIPSLTPQSYSILCSLYSPKEIHHICVSREWEQGAKSAPSRKLRICPWGFDVCWEAESLWAVSQSLALPATLRCEDNRAWVSLGESAGYHLAPVSFWPDMLSWATKKKCVLFCCAKSGCWRISLRLNLLEGLFIFMLCVEGRWWLFSLCNFFHFWLCFTQKTAAFNYIGRMFSDYFFRDFFLSIKGYMFIVDNL